MPRKRRRLPPIGPRRTPERDFLVAVHRLTGLNPSRVEAARAALRELSIPQVERELCRPTIDAAVAATLLAETLDDLASRGVERTKLKSKLRNDPDVWPTWAELQAASNLAEYLQEDGVLQLEAAPRRGKQADFRFSATSGDVFQFFPVSDSTGISIEFKAIGLSEEEAAFCQRARPTLEAVRPPRGFITLHVPLDYENEGVWLSDEVRFEALQEAIRTARRELSSPHVSGFSGAVVAAHGTEESYVRRLRSRITEAFHQLPAEDECWVAFHWSNGAPFAAVQAALDSVERPKHVAGILVVGSAVVLGHPEIHHFAFWGRADAKPNGDLPLHSKVDANLAEIILDRVERTSGIRASVVRAPIGGRTQDVLVRDGSQRILPFVLSIDPNPDNLDLSRLLPPR